MDSWYYPRIQLAEQCLKILEIGISSNLSIIAPRRKGKTLFMLHDLAEQSWNLGYVPVYVSLWQNVNSPQACLIEALNEALDSECKKSILSKILSAKINKVSIGNELIGRVGFEFAESPEKPTSNDLLQIDRLLTKLQKKVGNKTVLLLVDEVQHLATSASFDPLTHALRTMLDKRLGGIKAIFTGSSRHYMNLLFNKSKSPFYYFVESVPFPDLDDNFLNFLLNKVDDPTLTLKDLRKAFNDVNKSPYWLMKIVSYKIVNSTNLKKALEQTLRLIEAAEGFEEISQKLKLIDKLVFLALTKGENVFSKKMFEQVEKLTPVKGIPSNIQRSLKRLIEHNLISQMEKGEYHIEAPGLSKYLLEHEEVLSRSE